VYPLMIDGGLPADGGVIRSAEPDLEAGRALARLLGVPDVPVTRGTAPAGAAQLGSVDSAPMLDLVEQMLKLSDNVIAELLGREVARRSQHPASFAGAAAAVTAQIARLGVRAGISLKDASGLSVQDRIAPAALTAVLRAIASGAHPGLGNIVNAMPVAGWDGTLANRYQVGSAKAAAGRTRAKTGSLTGVTTLAGLVRDATGRLLVFAFLADAVAGPEETGAPALDAAAGALARCGCR
jgi:D-alanyl-D-alanine carboxypeptidase/D-alanyl-D-alanine-endopeptidase (penicillin-binding protein 4)